MKQSSDEAPDFKDAKVIFVLGGPGSGKGTQCAKLVEKYGFNHLSSGDLIRAEVESGSEMAAQLKATMDNGDLVTLDTVLDLLKSAMTKQSAENTGFLIDGFPREIEQGKRFESEIVECQCVLFFDVPEEVMKERILKRSETSGRADDNEETILKRLTTFQELSSPVIEHYTGLGKVKKINATGEVDEIFSQVVEVIDELEM